LRVEVTEYKKTNADVGEVLIDDVILAIKINASILSIQDIDDNLALFTTIPKSC
jgi:hypothetical protein